MANWQRSNDEPESVRRQDGGGETSPLPGSEAARGNEQPANKGADKGEVETWTPGKGETGIRPGSSPAEATMAGTAAADGPEQPDNDPQNGGGRMPNPGAGEAKPATGADAPSGGSR